MNTSNGLNSIQMFTAFLPEDFQIISQGQLKTVLRRFRSPTREAVAVLGPRADTPNAAEQPCEGRRCRTGCFGRAGGCWLGRGPRVKAAWVRRPRSSTGRGRAGAHPVPMNHVYCRRH